MSKPLKETLIIITSILIGIFFIVKMINHIGQSTLNAIGEAYGTECATKRDWTVGNYTIRENECIGFAGPPYRKFDLFENDNLIEDYVTMTDSCTVNFEKSNNLVVVFDFCKETIKKLTPQISVLNLANIDSIQIQSDSLDNRRLLTTIQIKKFLNDWNKKQPIGYSNQPFDSAFSANPSYTTYYYKLIIFSSKGQNRFYGRDNTILDSLNWKYKVGNKKHDYFGEELIR